MDRLGTRHATGRRLLLAAVLTVPALTLGGLVHAAGDDGPLDTGAVSGPTRPDGQLPPPPAAPDPDAARSSREPPAPVPAQPTDPPPAAATGQDASGQDASGQDATGQDTTGQDATGQDATGQDTSGSAPVPGTPTQPTTGSGPPATAAEDSPAGQPAAADTLPAATRVARTLAAVAEAGAQAGGTVEAVVLGPDGREQLASPGAGVPAWTASLSKTFVVQQLLESGDARQPLTVEDLALLERALVTSDDSAMNTLWVRFDGPALVAEAATEFGLTGTAVPADSGQWGEVTTTARDYAGFLHRLRYALDDPALATLTGWLQSTSDRAADGFDQTFGLRSQAAATGAPVAVKQGWMCCVDGRRQLHSAGSLADGRTVVLLGDFPASTSWDAAHSALDQAARAVVAGP